MSELYDVMTVREYTDKSTGEVRNRYNNVGTAFPHKDGKGFNIQVETGVAIFGKVMVRERNSKTDDTSITSDFPSGDE